MAGRASLLEELRADSVIVLLTYRIEDCTHTQDVALFCTASKIIVQVPCTYSIIDYLLISSIQHEGMT